MEELKQQFQELKLRLDKLEGIQSRNYKEYNFRANHENKPYNEQVYDKVCKSLVIPEYIIKKAFEENRGHISYSVGYITSFGNFIFSDRNGKRERTGYYNSGYNMTLNQVVLDNIIDHEFKMQSHHEVPKQLPEFIDQVHKILGMSELIPLRPPNYNGWTIINSDGSSKQSHRRIRDNLEIPSS